MKLKINEWPEGTEDYVNHRVLSEYIQDTARRSGVHERTLYDTRVEKVEKRGKGWGVRTSTLKREGSGLRRVGRDWVSGWFLEEYRDLRLRRG